MLKELDGWLRRRLRCYIWKQWKKPRRRRQGLIALGVEPKLAARYGASSKGPWAISGFLNDSLTPRYFDSLGLTRLARA